MAEEARIAEEEELTEEQDIPVQGDETEEIERGVHPSEREPPFDPFPPDLNEPPINGEAENVSDTLGWQWLRPTVEQQKVVLWAMVVAAVSVFATITILCILMLISVAAW